MKDKETLKSSVHLPEGNYCALYTVDNLIDGVYKARFRHFIELNLYQETIFIWEQTDIIDETSDRKIASSYALASDVSCDVDLMNRYEGRKTIAERIEEKNTSTVQMPDALYCSLNVIENLIDGIYKVRFKECGVNLNYYQETHQTLDEVYVCDIYCYTLASDISCDVDSLNLYLKKKTIAARIEEREKEDRLLNDKRTVIMPSGEYCALEKLENLIDGTYKIRFSEVDNDGFFLTNPNFYQEICFISGDIGAENYCSYSLACDVSCDVDLMNRHNEKKTIAAMIEENKRALKMPDAVYCSLNCLENLIDGTYKVRFTDNDIKNPHLNTRNIYQEVHYVQSEVCVADTYSYSLACDVSCDVDLMRFMRNETTISSMIEERESLEKETEDTQNQIFDVDVEIAIETLDISLGILKLYQITDFSELDIQKVRKILLIASELEDII